MTNHDSGKVSLLIFYSQIIYYIYTNYHYKNVQKAGFIIEFREHTSHMKGKKKGNVDVDIVFEIMRRVTEEQDFEKIVLVTGDGDYIKLVKYLIEKNIFEKILFPNKKFSSLYNRLAYNFGLNLSLIHVRKKIEYKKRRCS
ncbi:NYN domain-containing protein [Candidatus Gracilibacteria bacterium]|nr:NYN domain-containing protein [Candidatus Gracilibacteria bacterium]